MFGVIEMKLNWLVLARFWIFFASLAICINSYLSVNPQLLRKNPLTIPLSILFITSLLVASIKDFYKSYFQLMIVSTLGISLRIFEFSFGISCFDYKLSILFFPTLIFSTLLAVEDVTLRVSVNALNEKYFESKLLNRYLHPSNDKQWIEIDFERPRVSTERSQKIIERHEKTNNYQKVFTLNKEIPLSKKKSAEDNNWQISKSKIAGDRYFTLKIRRIH